MARTGRPKAELTLSDEERQTLERYVRRGKTSQRLAFRAGIVLACAKGASSKDVATKFKTSGGVVGKWRGRFIRLRLKGLSDAPRPGRPRVHDDDKIEEVVVTTLESMPRGATRWSTREMAKKAGLSASTVSRIWRAFELKPHRAESFQLSTDPDFIAKVRDVVGLYLDPPTNAIVLSVDEKSQVQALERTQPLLPMRPGQLERRTPEYQRHGTTTLFAALDVATGNVTGECFRRHRAIEFVKFLETIDGAVPRELEIHIVLDNFGTHKAPKTKRWLARHPRFHLHFIPTHSSWLNQVEVFFSVLQEKQIKRGSHRTVKDLEAAIKEFLAVTNEAPKPFKWTKTADEILRKLARTCEETVAIHTSGRKAD
jgi:transposase